MCELVKIPRDRPVLSADAVPTIYPNVPSNLSKKAPRKRKSKNSTSGLPSKTTRLEGSVLPNDERSESQEEQNDETPPDYYIVPLLDLMKYELPSCYWARHQIAGAENIVAFSVCGVNRQNLVFEKVVLCTQEDHSIHAAVFVQATEVKNVTAINAPMVEDILRQVDAMSPCKGFGEEGEFKASAKRNTKTCNGKCFSVSCPGISQTTGKPCPKCKHLRKLLLNQASYKKRTTKGPVKRPSYKMKLKTAKLKRSELCILKAKSQIQTLKCENSQIHSSVFKED